jgi:hypothetical protein
VLAESVRWDRVGDGRAALCHAGVACVLRVFWRRRMPPSFPELALLPSVRQGEGNGVCLCAVSRCEPVMCPCLPEESLTLTLDA